MAWSDYWGALSARQRLGLVAGFAVIAIAMVVFAVWLLRDPYVPLASGLTPERMNEVARDLDHAKVTFRVGPSGDEIIVPQSELGKARATVADGGFGAPPSVGLELFKEPDFSSTDFAQRINYQRALQGELTRTIQTYDGVRAARVHVILADPGVFKRDTAKSRAAVSLVLAPGKQLSAGQVHGIQQLVAASVPEIKIEDVVVLDESGASLTRANGDESEVSSVKLDLKREADQYLTGKVTRLLQEMVPQGIASVSVDAVLDDRQLRVTTEEPIAVHGSKDAEHATGVLVKERQSQHGRVPDVSTANDAIDGDSTDREFEYTVGHRMEQALSSPGSIKRLSVAVALKGAPPELTNGQVEQLVANAIGIDRARGDSVAVLLMPNISVTNEITHPAPLAGPSSLEPSSPAMSHAGVDSSTWTWPWILVVVLFAIAVAFWWRARTSAEEARISDAAKADVDAIAAQVRKWLREGVRTDV